MDILSAEEGMCTMREVRLAGLITDQARLQARAGMLSKPRPGGGLPSLTFVHHTIHRVRQDNTAPA